MAKNNRDCKATSILCVMMKSLQKGPSLMISDTRPQADAAYQLEHVKEAAAAVERASERVIRSIRDNHKVNQQYCLPRNFECIPVSTLSSEVEPNTSFSLRVSSLPETTLPNLQARAWKSSLAQSATSPRLYGTADVQLRKPRNASSLVAEEVLPAINFPSLQNECPDNDPNQCVLIYDDTFKSIVQEWGLVCNQKYRVALVQSVWMGGVLSGALLLASLPDIYGRYSTLVVSLIGATAFEGLAGFVKLYSVYITLRFLGGMLFAIVILGSFVFSQEVVGGSKRSLVGLLLPLAFSVGIALLSLVATYTTDWRTLTLFVSCLGVFTTLVILMLPESPRWLVSRGHISEAQAVLMKLARLNGSLSHLPPSWQLVPDVSRTAVMVDEDEETSNIEWLAQKKKRSSRKVRKVISKLEKKTAGLKDLVKHKYIVWILVVQIYSWFVNSAVYYGLTLAASDIGSNVYVSTALSGLVEVPSLLVAFPLIDRVGRRGTLVSFMVCGGISCLLMLLCTTGSSIYTTLALVGKLCISGSFSIAYIHSAEIFPTSIRNTGVGIVSVAARVGGILSPFMLMLGDLLPNLQYIVLGLLSLTAGLLNTQLPETLGRIMPETVEDVLDLRNRKGLPKTAANIQYSKLEEACDNGESEEEIIEFHTIGAQ
ncbi:Major facilitator sugar transporter-like [Trinorchestia longiramus]|nr:Major facilitator sugar transporter-like [Trinorchestia longiramus]